MARGDEEGSDYLVPGFKIVEAAGERSRVLLKAIHPDIQGHLAGRHLARHPAEARAAVEAQGGAKAFMKKHRAMATLLPARGLNTVFFGDLATVDLSRLDLGGAIGAAIGRALQVNTTLWRISLRDNKLGPEGGAALARALEHNTVLRQLSLRNNALGASGGAAIANALAANTTLLQLDLGNNGLGERGGAAIGRTLGGGAALQQLYLGFNDLGVEAGVAIADALAEDTALQQLNLWHCNLSADVEARIRRACEGKPGFKLTT